MLIKLSLSYISLNFLLICLQVHVPKMSAKSDKFSYFITIYFRVDLLLRHSVVMK